MRIRSFCWLPIVVSLISLPFAARAADVIAHFPFDKDLAAPEGLVLSPGGDAAISNSEFQFGGGALLLDGEGDHAWCVDPAFMVHQGDFALAFWYRRNRMDNQFEPLAGWGNSIANSGFAVRLTKSPARNEPPEIEGLLNDDDKTSVKAPQPDLQDSAFQHVVLQRKNGALELYLNGALVSSKDGHGESDLSQGEKRAGFLFSFNVGACNTHEDGTGTTGAFSGLIDEIWLFGSSLTPEEISSLKEKNALP